MSALTVTLGADITALKRAMASATELVGASAKRMAKLTGAGLAGVGKGLGHGLGLGLKVGLGSALAGGVGAAAMLAKSIGKAADMESFETAFVPLLGGIKEAKERMADLAEFAKVTPFELPEVVQASRMLEVLTKGALATSAGLTLVGDAASVAQQPFEDVAVWVGRLYDGLQSGRPVGEAMMRLQEMGLIAGDTRGEIEKLQKSGAAGNLVWAKAKEALTRFSGGMDAQSRTWKGKLSNLADAWGQLLTRLGTPVIDALKPYLDGLIAKVESMKPAFAALGENIRTTLDTIRAAWDTGGLAELVGTGIVLGVINGVNAFSSGIRKTMAYLAAAFTEIMKSAKDSWEFGNLISIFKNLGRALASMITEAILKALDAIPGLDLGDETKREKSNVENSLRTVGNILEDFNGAAAVQGAVDTVKRANAAGEDAASKAGNTDVLNPDRAQAAWAKVYGKLKARIDAQRSADEIFGEILSKKSGKPAVPPVDGTDGTGTASVRLDPIVSSLGKVGGGGYGTGVLDAQRENNQLTRTTNSILKDVVKKLDKPGWGGAVFA